MIPCEREPEPPAAGAGQVALNRWIVGVISAGEDCRKTSDAVQDWAKIPTEAKPRN